MVIGGSESHRRRQKNIIMKDFLQYLIKLIVDHPDEIKIEETDSGGNLYQYNILANKEDMGKIIGKEGKVIQAIRNTAKILAVKEGNQIRIEII